MRGASAAALRRFWLTLDLLVGRRLGLVALVDGMTLFFVAVQALLGDEFDPWPVVLVPGLLLGAPLLSELVALERRAGSLDIALSSPGADTYFERRAGSLLVALFAQGAFLLLAFRVLRVPYAFHLAPALLKSGVAFTFLAATALFWAVRLATAGAVLFATWLSVLALGPWLFPSPVLRIEAKAHLEVATLLSFTWDVCVLALAAAVLYAYARRRLSRPESLLS